ncbi:MAG: hypothetical protein AAFR28_13440 [Pseudomonadota bacterium]
MKSTLAGFVGALALFTASCAGSPSEEAPVEASIALFELAPKLLAASYQNWLDNGQRPRPEIAFRDTEAFDGALYASLDQNKRMDGVLTDVVVKFYDDTQAVPARNYKWLSVVAVKHGGLLKCDLNETDYEVTWILKALGLVRDALQIREAAQYKGIVEYNSYEGSVVAIRYYDASIPDDEKTAMYAEGACQQISIQDLMDNVIETEAS